MESENQENSNTSEQYGNNDVEIQETPKRINSSEDDMRRESFNKSLSFFVEKEQRTSGIKAASPRSDDGNKQSSPRTSQNPITIEAETPTVASTITDEPVPMAKKIEFDEPPAQEEDEKTNEIADLDYDPAPAPAPATVIREKVEEVNYLDLPKDRYGFLLDNEAENGTCLLPNVKGKKSVSFEKEEERTKKWQWMMNYWNQKYFHPHRPGMFLGMPSSSFLRCHRLSVTNTNADSIS